MKQNTYYENVINSVNRDYIFITFSYRTHNWSGYNKNNKKIERLIASHNDILRSIDLGNFKKITYKKAMELIKPVTNKTEHITYYNNPFGFIVTIAFFSYNSYTDKTTRHYKNGKQEDAPDFNKDVIDRFVDRKEWVIISKDETEKLLNPVKKDIIYYNRINDFIPKEQFLSYNPNTKETKIHNIENKNGKIATNCYSYDICEQFVKEKNWKHITKDEAYALLKTGEIIYYTTNNPQGFLDDTKFLSYDVDTGVTKIHSLNNKEGIINSNSYTFKSLEDTVKFGYWRHITKEEAEALLKAPVKDEDDNSGLLENSYTVRCFLNGVRKMTDKLTMEEAYTFRKAAGNLYNYLTKEYKLSKSVKE